MVNVLFSRSDASKRDKAPNSARLGSVSDAGREGGNCPNRARISAGLSSALSSGDFDVRDPMIAVLLDVQRGRIGSLTALYRVRALVAGGWR